MRRKSNEYQTDVREAIISCGIARTYVRKAPENKQFPYVTFEVRAIGESRDVVELDLWGLKGKEAQLSDMADAIEEGIDGYIIANNEHSSLLSTNNDMKWIDDDDENIIRINMSFNATYQA